MKQFKNKKLSRSDKKKSSPFGLEIKEYSNKKFQSFWQYLNSESSKQYLEFNTFIIYNKTNWDQI